MPTQSTLPARMCGATNRDGTACKRAPIRGGTRCTLHGGNSPLARMKASEALAAAAWPAAEVLFEIIERWKERVCPTCGLPKGDPTAVIRAAQVVLDRTGFHPSMTLEVAQGSTSRVHEYMAWVPQEQLEQISQWLREAEDRMRRGLPRQDGTNVNNRTPTVVEADVIVEAEPERLNRRGE
jgi:hypothetical protein